MLFPYLLKGRTANVTRAERTDTRRRAQMMTIPTRSQSMSYLVFKIDH